MTNLISRVIAFNQDLHEIYHDPTGSEVLLVDVSASVGAPAISRLMQTAVATLLRGRAVTLPKPSGCTGIIHAVESTKGTRPSTIWLLTDGEENCWEGPLRVGPEEVRDVSFRSQRNQSGVLADYLQETGIRVCILGMGQGARPMVAEMLGRRNVFVAHVDPEAASRTVVDVLETLRSSSTSHALLLPVPSSRPMPCLESVQFEHAQPSLQSQLEAIMSVYEDRGLFEHDIRHVWAVLLLGMEAMAERPTPAGLVTSRHSAVVSTPYRQHCNRLFSRFADAGLLTRAEPLTAANRAVVYQGQSITFPAGSSQYRCVVSQAAVAALAKDGRFCLPRAELKAGNPKKRRRS